MNEPMIMEPMVEHVDIDAAEHRFHCIVPHELAPLRGHFPGFPIVPGVCQIRWVVKFWEQISGQPARIERMTQVKFHQFLRPGDRFCLSLEPNNGTVRYRVFLGDVQFASGRLVLRP